MPDGLKINSTQPVLWHITKKLAAQFGSVPKGAFLSAPVNTMPEGVCLNEASERQATENCGVAATASKRPGSQLPASERNSS